jgi:hypothetical protein
LDLPLLGPLWNYFTSSAWGVALNLTEMASLGRKAWYWRLHSAAAHAYRRDSAIRVMGREGHASALPPGQLVYGETPAISMLAMLARVGAGPDDVVFDLGCGRGLAALTAGLALGVEAVGIDVLPTFVERGSAMAERLRVADRVTFQCADFRACDLSRGTIFYAAATTFDKDILDEVAAIVASRAPGPTPTRFMTLSHPLLPPWRMIDKGRFPMTWGWNTVYFHSLP